MHYIILSDHISLCQPKIYKFFFPHGMSLNNHHTVLLVNFSSAPHDQTERHNLALLRVFLVSKALGGKGLFQSLQPWSCREMMMALKLLWLHILCQWLMIRIVPPKHLFGRASGYHAWSALIPIVLQFSIGPPISLAGFVLFDLPIWSCKDTSWQADQLLQKRLYPGPPGQPFQSEVGSGFSFVIAKLSLNPFLSNL